LQRKHAAAQGLDLAREPAVSVAIPQTQSDVRARVRQGE
jgi:hypothetical protein